MYLISISLFCSLLQRNVGDLQWRRCSIRGSLSLPRDDPLLTSWNRLLDAGLAACFDEWSPNGRTASARQAGHAEPLASPDTSRRRQLWVFWHCNEMPDWERLVASDLEGPVDIIAELLSTMHSSGCVHDRS